MSTFDARRDVAGLPVDGPLTFTEWLSAGPFVGWLPTPEEAIRLEIAFTAGMRAGRESEPPLHEVPGE